MSLEHMTLREVAVVEAPDPDAIDFSIKETVQKLDKRTVEAAVGNRLEPIEVTCRVKEAGG
ncbi:hypothetical protein ACLI4Y_11275 [Natrialbaceae archaeon A-CW3]